MSADFPVALIPVIGGLLTPLLPMGLRRWSLLLLPCATFYLLLGLESGTTSTVLLFGFEITPLRVDKLGLAFAYVFCIAAFLNALFAWRIESAVEPTAAMVYAGAAIGAVLAGDLLTLFVYWEAAAIASALVIWARGTQSAWRAGMRYIVVQLGSGMLLAAGAAIYYAQTQTLAFDRIGLDAPGGLLIFLAFGVKAAFPLLHNWLQDSYPEASPTGTVVLSAYTTKLGIYALARAFPGTEELLWIGTAMAAFPIFYAVIENDLRRVLAYSVNNQLGFMVVGIGLGTELGINGAVAHAFADILFKALLFMSMGAVLLRTGTVNGTDLGGLYKSMPWTTGFCIVGAASISAFPLFSGFVTKSMIMTSAADQGHVAIWLVLLFASAGVFHHAGIKIPYFAFFAHDSGIRCKEAPASMLAAMAIAAALCIGIGVFPDLLYALLPFAVDYVPYTASHVLAQLQLLVFSALAFAVLMRTGVYPPELRAVNLDFDWVYRRAGMRIVSGSFAAYSDLSGKAAAFLRAATEAPMRGWSRLNGANGLLRRQWPSSSMALWVMAMLAAYLVLYYTR
jgi:multicomponent Na+:H+ antiporter subunit D